MGVTYRVIAKSHWFHREVKLPTTRLRLHVCYLSITSAFVMRSRDLVQFQLKMQTGSLDICRMIETIHSATKRWMVSKYKKVRVYSVLAG